MDDDDGGCLGLDSSNQIQVAFASGIGFQRKQITENITAYAFKFEDKNFLGDHFVFGQLLVIS